MSEQPTSLLIFHSGADTDTAQHVRNQIAEYFGDDMRVTTSPFAQLSPKDVKQHHALIILFSPAAIASEHLLSMVEIALYGTITVIPVIVQAVPLPDVLNHLFAFDFTGAHAIEDVISVLEEQFGGDSFVVSSAAAAEPDLDDAISFEDSGPLRDLEEAAPEPEMSEEEPSEPAAKPSTAPPPAPAPAPAQQQQQQQQQQWQQQQWQQQQSAPPESAHRREAPESATREQKKREARREPAASPGTAGDVPLGLLRPDTPSSPPQFAAFFPEEVKPAKAYAMLIFAHIEDEQVQRVVHAIAEAYAELMGGKQSSKAAQSRVLIDPGTAITVVPQIEGVSFDSAEQTITWQPPYVSAKFLFTTPSTLSGDLSGVIQVWKGVLIAGEIPVTMRVVTADQPASGTLSGKSEMRAFDPIFASYSRRDMPVMEYFRRTRANMGQHMLVDIHDIRVGEFWSDRLLEMIDQSAVFQLFWSKHSAGSDYCRMEWEHALSYLDQRPRFIQPVYWHAPDPDPSPPPELSHIHFKQVTLPPITRAQLVLAHVRRWLRR